MKNVTVERNDIGVLARAQTVEDGAYFGFLSEGEREGQYRRRLAALKARQRRQELCVSMLGDITRHREGMLLRAARP